MNNARRKTFFRSRQTSPVDPAWVAMIMASYRSLNPEQAFWFDNFSRGADAENYLENLLFGDDIYLWDTFKNETDARFIYLINYEGRISHLISSNSVAIISGTGPTLRWNAENLYYQIGGSSLISGSLIDYTFTGINFVTVTSTVNFENIISWQNQSSVGWYPRLKFPELTGNFWFRNISGFADTPMPAFELPKISGNFFWERLNSGSTAPLLVMPDLAGVFEIRTNRFTGDVPPYFFPKCSTYTMNNCRWSTMNNFLLNLYNNRFNQIASNPFVNISGTLNPLPTGIYQDSVTPLTDKELMYKLIENPNGESRPNWAFTVRGGLP